VQPFWTDFITIALAHFLAVASPGPDFTIVAQHSLTAGRRTAYWTSAGIGLGILVHVTYALLGIGWMMRENALLFEGIKVAGAVYLIYLGWRGLRSQKPSAAQTSPQSASHPLTGLQALRTGFITNVLNPKATLFFVALFSVVVSTATPRWALAVYGVWMSLATLLWFIGIATLFGHPRIRNRLVSHTHWIDRCMGLVLLGIGLHLLIFDQNLLAIAS
jgi:RhtB (resistance to homoserine/threonine) family protein